jgi:hypothetical protein
MRFYRFAVLLGILAGCSFERPRSGEPSPVEPDGSIQSACVTWGPFDGGTDPCSASLGTPMALSITVDATYDTSTGTYTLGGTNGLLPGTVVTRSGPGHLRIVNLMSLEVPQGRKLTLTGSFSVLFLVHGNVSIEGTLDASAVRAVTSGPGAESALCGSGSPTSLGKAGIQASSINTAGGGGGGGAFGDDGGDGGDGEGPIAMGARGVSSPGNLPLRGGARAGAVVTTTTTAATKAGSPVVGVGRLGSRRAAPSK